jgi:hypothetical protein
MAKISDVALLETARNEAIKLFKMDPGIKKKENQPLAKEMERVWSSTGEWS